MGTDIQSQQPVRQRNGRLPRARRRTKFGKYTACLVCVGMALFPGQQPVLKVDLIGVGTMRVVGPGGVKQDHLLYVLAVQQQAAAWTVIYSRHFSTHILFNLCFPWFFFSALFIPPAMKVSSLHTDSLEFFRKDYFGLHLCAELVAHSRAA